MFLLDDLVVFTFLLASGSVKCTGTMDIFKGGKGERGTKTDTLKEGRKS